MAWIKVCFADLDKNTESKLIDFLLEMRSHGIAIIILAYPPKKSNHDQEKIPSEKSLLEIAIEVFRELHGPEKKPVSRDSFLDALEKTNKFDRGQAERMINTLHKLGVIYEIRPGYYSSV